MAGPYTLYGMGPRSAKVELVAAFAQVELDKAPFTMGITNKTPWYRQMNPNGKQPILVTPGGPLYESNAICRFLATRGPGGHGIYPPPASADDVTRALIDMWMDWSNSFDAPTAQCLYPILGFSARPFSEEQFEQGWRTFEQLMQAAEQHLTQRGTPFLTGHDITLADLVVATSVMMWWVVMMDARVRAAYPRVTSMLERTFQHPLCVKTFKGASMVPAQERAVYHATGPAWGSGPHPLSAIMPMMMEPWSGTRVRAAFKEFFETKGHTYWPSSPVVPHNDPTLLFTNAGMNQYKPVFLGTVDPNSDMGRLKRACNSQKCIRAGGKHNDLDDVGKDVYHHTFFEMLGNWSFGDYFKQEAISWAWELLTKVYKLPAERLYATYFQGDHDHGLPADDEAREIWLQFLPASRVLPFGNKDNFWEMGDQGPCGPCTEIHYDRVGGRDAASLVNEDDPNVLEIWNNVFIQYNREADGSLRTLPARHVDTGMGLERVTSIMQDKMSNYATDLFTPIFDEIARITKARPYLDRVGKDDEDGKDMAYRVVADHIRTLCFSMADGARPGAEGRDYVLRRVLRRAVRYGREVLGAKEGFFAQLVDVVVANFQTTFPELRAARAAIHSVIAEEESSFSRTLVKGIERFKKQAEALQKEGKSVVGGPDAFELWDTFGFPVDLTQLMAEERGLTVDKQGFEAAMAEAKERSRASGKKATGASIKFEAEATGWLQKNGVPLTDDSHKYVPADVTATVKAILTPQGYIQSTSELTAAGPLGLILDRSSFYAESGGQVGDTGLIVASSGSAAVTVKDAQVAAGYVLHVAEVANGALSVGDGVTVKVDYARRDCIAPNHTFTHVLNFALRKVLGEHVDQKGSIVLPDKLRFDFANNGPVDAKQLAAVEAICREQLASDYGVHSMEVALPKAKEINGLRAVFGEVYPDPVRVVSVGRPVEQLLATPSDPTNRDFSIEFCGGTHLTALSKAAAFAVISEEGIAKGIRRVIALTRDDAQRAIAEGQRLEAQVAAAAQIADVAELDKAVTACKQSVDVAVISVVQKAILREQMSALSKRVQDAAKAAAAANKALATSQAVSAADAAASAGRSYLGLEMSVGTDAKAVLEAWNAIQAKHKGIVATLISKDADKGKVLAFAGVPESLTSRLRANDLANAALAELGGKGGGKPTTAQGQGTNLDKIGAAFAAAEALAAKAGLA